MQALLGFPSLMESACSNLRIAPSSAAFFWVDHLPLTDPGNKFMHSRLRLALGEVFGIWLLLVGIVLLLLAAWSSTNVLMMCSCLALFVLLGCWLPYDIAADDRALRYPSSNSTALSSLTLHLLTTSLGGILSSNCLVVCGICCFCLILSSCLGSHLTSVVTDLIALRLKFLGPFLLLLCPFFILMASLCSLTCGGSNLS